MGLVCVIAGWSVSQLSSWWLLHSPVEHAASYYIMNRFYLCCIKYLFDIFETAMYLGFSYALTHFIGWHTICFCWWVLERKEWK